MRGHIVRAFVIVRIACIFRCNPVQPTHHIAAHFGCCIFLNAKRGRGVAAEHRQQTGAYALLLNPPCYFAGDFMQSLSGGGDG